MNFEQPDFNNESILEEENYKKARSEADVLLDRKSVV